MKKGVIIGIVGLVVIILGVAGYIYFSGEEQKECNVKEDCLNKTCFTKDCVDYNCSYSQIIPCCGDGICEIGETYELCADDCVKSGVINKDETWAGTIHVTGDIDINPDVTLTILPGTIIEVAAQSDDQHKGRDHPHDSPFPKDPDRKETQSTKIMIHGILNATGTPDNKIIFTSSNKENPTTYDWDGLDIFHGRLEYAIVEYARYNGVQHYSDVIISNSIFRNSLECCICIGHNTPVSPQILYNDVYNCGHEGIDYAGGSALIKGNRFHLENPEIQPDPSKGGIGIVVYKNAYPIIEDNVFEKLTIAILFHGNSRHPEEQGKKVILRNNKIENNRIGFNIAPNQPADVIIEENNQLINNEEDRTYF